MIWVWAPITVFRQIHEFHHGANRRAAGIATLDVYQAKSRMGRVAHICSWYLLVFAGGFFFHTLASIILFLVLPRSLGMKLSPAFNSWTFKKRMISWIEFACSLGIHGCAILILDFSQWLYLLAFPTLVFAWVWSAMLYIYHYRTTIGKKVQYNTRSLPDIPVFSWLLLNFNHHSVHHNNPNIPWYELPFHANPQPESVKSQNQNVGNLAAAIFQQVKGPIFVEKSERL
jgi:fatty acid desaturase